MSKVSIIVLNWNDYKETKECVESLNKIIYSNYEVIIVDNGSEDGSTQRIRKEFPQYRYIYNHQNLGYAKAMNRAIEDALARGADYIFPLNNDARVEDGECFEKLINFAESDSEIGIAGPRFIFPSGSYQSSAYNIFMPVIIYLFLPDALANFILFGFGRQFDKPKEVLWVSGMFLIKKKLIENLGLFDERFFMGGEDVDYCLRAKKFRWKIVYYPQIYFMHKRGASAQRFEGQSVAANFNKLAIEAMIQLLYKWKSRPVAYLYRILLVLGFYLRGIEWLFRSIVGDRKNKMKIANDFFNASKLTFQTVPK